MSIPKNSICPICRVPLREYHDFVTCETCQTSYHEKCWRESGGCPSCDVVEESVSVESPAIVFWYLFHNNRNLGPLTWEELCSHPGILPDDLVWNKEMPDWIRADQVPDLPLVKKTPETPDEKVGETEEPKVEETTPEIEEHPTAETKPSEKDFPDPDDGGYLFSPGSDQGSETGEPNMEAATLEMEEYPATETSPLESTPPERFEMEQDPKAIAVETPAIPLETELPELSHSEQLVEQIYTGDKPVGRSIGAAELEDPDDRMKAALGHARRLIAGILLFLGGAIAAATTYFYAPVSGTIYYLISAGAIVFGVIGFFSGLFGWLKLKPWQSDGRIEPLP